MNLIRSLISKRDGSEKMGRGFSRDELKKAGITKIQARTLNLAVDEKRKSSNDENVECIKAHAAKLLPAAKKTVEKPKKKAKS